MSEPDRFEWEASPFYIDISEEIEDHLLGSDGIIYEKAVFDDQSPEPIKYKYVTKEDRGKTYWTVNNKWIDIDKLFARYFLPSTKLPTDPYWNTIKLEKSNPVILQLIRIKWAKPTARKGANLKEKYISKSGDYFILRIGAMKYANRFKELKDAVARRQELLGF
jgi:hypothetical protein